MDNRYRFVVGFLTVLNALLTLLLCGLVRDTRQDINALRTILATKQDLVNVAAPKLAFFHEEKCTGCHTERRFAGPHNVRGEIDQAIAHMRALPDARFSEKDVEKIHASLELLRCSQCHGVDQLRKLSIMSPSERMRVVRQMVAKPGSNITPDEAGQILRGYEQMVGF
jgi:hypothetical protein